MGVDGARGMTKRKLADDLWDSFRDFQVEKHCFYTACQYWWDLRVWGSVAKRWRSLGFKVGGVQTLVVIEWITN
jgi:hypothetical protein